MICTILHSHLLENLWLTALAHLWQTTVVLCPLLLLGWLMRNGPARLLNMLWWVALLKLFLPLSLLAPVGRRTLLPFLGQAHKLGVITVTLSAWLREASAVLHPAVIVMGTRAGAAKAKPGIFEVMALVWVAGVVWLVHTWSRAGPGGNIRDCIRVRSAGRSIGLRLRAAIEGTQIGLESVYISRSFSAPAVTGLLRPRIVIPARMIDALRPMELRAILLHENEHRKRLDPLRLFIQRCALAIFFYYPLVWLIVRRLNSSRELACDDAALRAGIGPATYARALARTLNLGLLPSGSTAAVGSRKPSLIRQRFSRLSQQGRYAVMTRHRLALAAAIVIVAAFSLVPLSPMATTGEPTNITPPKLIAESKVLPEYPEGARKDGMEGQVVLEVLVLEDGTVGQVSIQEEIPGHPAFGASARDAVSQWRFEPAIKKGRSIDMTVTIPVAFRLDEKPEEAQIRKPDPPPPEKVTALSKPTATPGEGRETLVTMPTLLKEFSAPPVYPEEARKAKIEGRLLLEILVRSDGTVGSVTVKEAIVDHPTFGENAKQAALGWRFTPGTKDGQPADMTVTVPLEFRLDD
jgi:bla regulator protein BlaR1